MKVKGDVVRDIIKGVEALPFVDEVYVITPKEGADIGLLIKGKGKGVEHVHEINNAINKVAIEGEEPENWVFVYWEWEDDGKK